MSKSVTAGEAESVTAHEVINIIHHDAEYETQKVWVVDKAAYDEKVVDHYECACGATHK